MSSFEVWFLSSAVHELVKTISPATSVLLKFMGSVINPDFYQKTWNKATKMLFSNMSANGFVF